MLSTSITSASHATEHPLASRSHEAGLRQVATPRLTPGERERGVR